MQFEIYHHALVLFVYKNKSNVYIHIVDCGTIQLLQHNSNKLIIAQVQLELIPKFDRHADYWEPVLYKNQVAIPIPTGMPFKCTAYDRCPQQMNQC